MIDNYKSLVTEVSNRFPLIGQALVSHRNTRGMPMSFQDFPYLPSLYAELPKTDGVDIRKAVQTGLSELFIVLSLYEAGWLGRIVAYVLPTFGIRDRFVKSRINNILLQSKQYRDLLPSNKDKSHWEVGNNRMKRFGSGSLLFLGSNTVVDFVEFSADTLIIDEFDQCDKNNLAKAKDRLRASTNPKMFRLGNPTIPGTGVCELFDLSDQRYWFTKCTCCGAWQCLDWFNNFVVKDDSGRWVPRDTAMREQVKNSKVENLQGNMRPVCVKCSHPFDRTVVGQWVSAYPERSRAGYTLSRLPIISESMVDIYKEWDVAQADSARLASFYTSILGLGFEFSGARLSLEDLNECSTGEPIDYVGDDQLENHVVSMGVDVGTILNVTISVSIHDEENDRVVRQSIFIGGVRHFEEIREMIIRYNVNVCVIDSMPETRKCQELRDWAPQNSNCIVWLCRFYPTSRVGKEKYGRKLNWREKICTVDRTQIFDATFDEIKNRTRIFPEDIKTVLGWPQQMQAPVRVLNNEKGRIIWTEGGAPDHYRLSDIYDRVALDLAAMSGTYTAF